MPPLSIPDYLRPQIDNLDKQINETKAMLCDPEMASIASEEIKRLEAEKNSLLSSLKTSSSDNVSDEAETVNYNKAIIEIRGAAGGEEAKIWAKDLLRMYLRFAEKNNWKVQMLTDLSAKISGKEVFSALQNESGVHRVQRVPETEKNGRIHTSTATVAVLPIVPPAQVEINPKDLVVEFYRSGGHGGQNVNKVSTAVRLKHLPSGIVIECQQERTQMQNRLIAEELLRSRLWEIEEEKRLSKITAERRSAVGRGDRSEKIRTYNYPQNRVTDHRIKKSWHNLETILDGELSKLIQALKAVF